MADDLIISDLGEAIIAANNVTALQTLIALLPDVNIQSYSPQLSDIVTEFGAAEEGEIVRKKLDGSGLEFAPINPELSEIADTITNLGKSIIAANNLTTLQTLLALLPDVNIQSYSPRLSEIVTGFATAGNGQLLRKKLNGTGLEFASTSTKLKRQFNNADLSNGTYTVIHGFNDRPSSVRVIHPSGDEVWADVTDLNLNTIAINLIDFVPLQGVWEVILNA